VERLRSGLMHHAATHQALRPQGLLVQIERGYYSRALDRLERHFPREQIQVLQFERCVRDPARELGRTYKFLGLNNAEFIPPTPGEPVNPSRGKRAELTCDAKAQLRAEYEPDVRRLADEWPDIDLSLWPSFEDLAP